MSTSSDSTRTPCVKFRDFGDHHASVTRCSLSNDGSVAVSAANDETVRIWNTSKDGSRVLLANDDERLSMCYTDCSISSDARTVAATVGGSVRLWNAKSGRPIATFRREGYSVAKACALSEDNGVVVVAFQRSHTGFQCELVSYHIASRAVLHSWEKDFGVDGGSGRVGCAISHDGNTLACLTIRSSKGTERGVEVVDMQEGASLRKWSLEKHCRAAIAMDKNGTRVLINDGSTIRVGSVSFPHVRERTLYSEFLGQSACCISGDGLRAAVPLRDHCWRVYDVDSGWILTVLEGPGPAGRACAMSMNGSHMITSTANGALRVWNLDVPRPPVFLLSENCVRTRYQQLIVHRYGLDLNWLSERRRRSLRYLGKRMTRAMILELMDRAGVLWELPPPERIVRLLAELSTGTEFSANQIREDVVVSAVNKLLEEPRLLREDLLERWMRAFEEAAGLCCDNDLTLDVAVEVITEHASPLVHILHGTKNDFGSRSVARVFLEMGVTESERVSLRMFLEAVEAILLHGNYAVTSPHSLRSCAKREGFETAPVSDEEQLCVICLDTMDVKEEVVRLYCEHEIHAACATPLLRLNRMPSCPICRFPIRALTPDMLPKRAEKSRPAPPTPRNPQPCSVQ